MSYNMQEIYNIVIYNIYHYIKYNFSINLPIDNEYIIIHNFVCYTERSFSFLLNKKPDQNERKFS